MNKELQIFIKEDFYSVGKEYVILFSLLIFIFLSYFINSFNEIKNELLDAIGTLLIFITFPYIIILMISNFFRHERLNGKLIGSLVFEEDKIHFDKKNFAISDIEKIEILSWDVKGDFVNSSFEFKPHKSNGVKNYVRLNFKNGSKEICYFQQTKSKKIQIFKDVFQIYYRKNLIERQNFLNIT